MSERERTPLWQIVRLRLRALQGWGYDVPELRQWARFYAYGARVLSILTAALFALSFVIFIILPRMGIGAAYAEPVSFTVGRLSSELVIGLLLMMVFIYLGRRHIRLAEAGAHQASATLDGFCYATAPAPPNLFALIGLTREQAQWFCLPIDWDATVEPSSDRFELIYNPVTGYVEWLRRIGAEPREQGQEESPLTSDNGTVETDAEDGSST